MNKLAVLIIILILISGMFIGIVTAETTKVYSKTISPDLSDYIKEDYNSEYGAITLKSDLYTKSAEYSLVRNTKTCLYSCEAEGKVKLYSDAVLFDDTRFKDSNGVDVSIDSDYYIFRGYEDNYIEVPDVTKQTCEDIVSENGTSIRCIDEVISYKIVNQPKEIWDKYNGEQLRAGEYRWKITGTKEASQSIDFIPIVNSKEFSEWAWWVGVTPTAYWKLNEASGNAIDSLGVYNLTAQGTPIYSVGKLSNSVNGTSSTNYLKSANNQGFADFGTGNFTIALWIKMPTTATSNPFIANCDGWINAGCWVIYKNTSNGLVFGGDAGDILRSTNNVANGVWTRVVITRAGTAMTMYVNGVSNGTATSSKNFVVEAGRAFHIAHPTGLTETFMNIDDVQIFKGYAWSSADVVTDYNGGVGIEGDYNPTSITINNSYPANNQKFTTRTINFSCNASSIGQNITSIVLNVTGTSTWTQTISGLATTSYNATFTNSTLVDGTYSWNCIAYGSSSINSSSSITNLSLDATFPLLSLLANNLYTLLFPFNVSLSPLSSDSNLQSCGYNINGTNVSYTCNSSLNVSVSQEGVFSFTFYANDSFGNFNSTSVSFSSLCAEGTYYQQNGVCNPYIGGVGNLNLNDNPIIQNSTFFRDAGDTFKNHPWAFVGLVCLGIVLIITASKGRR